MLEEKWKGGAEKVGEKWDKMQSFDGTHTVYWQLVMAKKQ